MGQKLNECRNKGFWVGCHRCSRIQYKPAVLCFVQPNTFDFLTTLDEWKKVIRRILLVLNESTLSMIPVLFVLKNIFIRTIRCNEYNDTHRWWILDRLEGWKGALHVYKGDDQRVGWGSVGGGMEYPRRRWSGEPPAGKLNIDAKWLVKRLF